MNKLSLQVKVHLLVQKKELIKLKKVILELDLEHTKLNLNLNQMQKIKRDSQWVRSMKLETELNHLAQLLMT